MGRGGSSPLQRTSRSTPGVGSDAGFRPTWKIGLPRGVYRWTIAGEGSAGMYEQPSIQWLLATQRHAQFVHETERARLSTEVERRPSRSLSFLKSVVAHVQKTLAVKRVEVRHTAPTSA
jgi:hypothetical protein